MFLRQSTTGWKLCVLWKDSSTSWENISDLKESHPIETAEYAVSQSLEREPSFNFWVPIFLKKRALVVSLVKQRSERYLKYNQNYGFNLTKTVEEELMSHKVNGNMLWSDAIAKEMTNIKVAFKFFDDNESVPGNHQFVKCHIIFHVKMDNFRRKARLVSGGHVTKDPVAGTYSTVVYRETVHISPTIAMLNNLQVKFDDVLNAYINAPFMDLICTTLGPEFVDDQGKTAILVRTLYSLKSSGAAFCKHLGECMFWSWLQTMSCRS